MEELSALAALAALAERQQHLHTLTEAYNVKDAQRKALEEFLQSRLVSEHQIISEFRAQTDLIAFGLEEHTRETALLYEQTTKTREEICVLQQEIASLSLPTPDPYLLPQDVMFSGIKMSDSDSDSGSGSGSEEEEDEDADAFAKSIQDMMDAQEADTAAASPSHHDGVRMLVDSV